MERLSVDREGKKVELIVVRPMEVRWAGFAITFLIGATIGSFGEFGLPRLRPLHAEDVELWPEVGDGLNRGRRHIMGVFEPLLLH